MGRFGIAFVVLIALVLSGCGVSGQRQTQGDLTVTLATNPPTPIVDRPTTFELTLQRNGNPVDSAYVTLMRQMPGMRHNDEGRLVAESLGNGRYTAQSSFAMGSRWNVIVEVVIADAPPQALTFAIEVDQP
ncbi:MAG: FixH family protein [Chloroflexi bacterium SZAS-1]|nr:FixH family protein [Chloroflexi bacterium SZAS-1]